MAREYARITENPHGLTGSWTVGKRYPTYREVLKRSEASIAQTALRVRVVVTAEPDRCLVKYRSILENELNDAGLTTADLQLSPKYYVFECECGTPVKAMRVDCTTDRKVIFQCTNPQRPPKGKKP